MKFAKIAVISAILATASASSIAKATAEKTVVESAAELPQTVFTLKNSPSDILFADNQAFKTIADPLSENIASLLTNYEISDPSTKRRLLEIQRSIALVEERWEDALALSPKIRALHSKPAEIAWSGILEDTFATAAKDTGASSGVKFKNTFRRLYEARIQSLDYSLVGD